MRTALILGGLGLAGLGGSWVAGLEGQTPASEQPAQASALARYSLDQDHRVQWRLPNRLREISGLAVASTDRVFTHDDERAVIYEIDVREQRIAKRFALGDPPVRDDFEGLFVLEDRFFLVTSDGVLFESLEGDDGERLDYNMYVTGAGRLCEVEGLAANVARTHLLLACKTPRTRELRPWVTLLPWSIEERRLEPDRMIRFPLDAFTGEVKGDDFSPSGLSQVPGDDHFFLVAAEQNAIAEISLDSRLWSITSLDEGRHPQTEGVAFLSDGTLVLADEGSGRRGLLTFYRIDAGTPGN